jgi:hypothetical protein
MKRDFDQYKKRHLAFWELSDVESPLIGFTIGTGLDLWSYWQDNAAARALLQQGKILAERIQPEDFVADQRKYLRLSAQIDDDVCRTAMPLASIPWMEAILGCEIIATEASMKSREILDSAGALQIERFNPDNPWIKKYMQFIDVYFQAFGAEYPVAQSVLRGPSDLASALLGAENATMSLATDPEDMHRLLGHVTSHLEEFLRLQSQYLPEFHNGYVIGQYEIWAPEAPIRIQEDFSVMYSPQLYAQFLKHLDEKLGAISNYTLLHLHSSSLFLIDQFLEVSTIRAFQVTKDPGRAKLQDMMPALLKIQKAAKPLIIKGQFDENDLDLIRRQLSLPGLCIQPVVKDLAQAEKLLPELRQW